MPCCAVRHARVSPASIIGLVLIIVAAVVPNAIFTLVDDGLVESIIIDSPEASGHEGFTTNEKSPTIMHVCVLCYVHMLFLQFISIVIISYHAYHIK
jgi:hypothetical protein